MPTSSPTGDIYILVAAVIHMIDEIERRIDGDIHEHPIDPVLHNLVAAAEVLNQVAPNDGTSPLSFRHAARPDHWDFESWFAQKGGALAEYVGAAVGHWSCYTAIAEANPDGPVEAPFAAFEHALAAARAYATVIHDQIIDDGLVVLPR